MVAIPFVVGALAYKFDVRDTSSCDVSRHADDM
jgi:hypothetical protein